MTTVHVPEGMPQSEFEELMASLGMEGEPGDPAAIAAAAHGDSGGDGEGDPDEVLGTDDDPDFVEHGNHGDDYLQQVADGDVPDCCPYCPTAEELRDQGDDHHGEGDGDAAADE